LEKLRDYSRGAVKEGARLGVKEGAHGPKNQTGSEENSVKKTKLIFESRSGLERRYIPSQPMWQLE
jgi:hypothetical protein